MEESNKSELKAELIYGLNDRPPLRETLFAALQHLLAIFVAIITPPLIIAGALKLDIETTSFLVSMALFASGVSTFIQCRRIGGIGTGLLCIQGTSFSFIGPIISAGLTGGLPVIFGACMAASTVEMLISRLLKYTRKIITPLVSGIVVTLIGMSLIKVGITACGGGAVAKSNGTFGSFEHVGLAALVLLLIIFFNRSSNRYLRMSSIVIGLVIGYAVAWCMGLVDFSSVQSYGGFNIPVPFKYGLSFDWSAFIALGLVYLITAIEAYGDITANSLISGEPVEGKTFVNFGRWVQFYVGRSVQFLPELSLCPKQRDDTVDWSGEPLRGILYRRIPYFAGTFPGRGSGVLFDARTSIGRCHAIDVRHSGFRRNPYYCSSDHRPQSHVGDGVEFFFGIKCGIGARDSFATAGNGEKHILVRYHDRWCHSYFGQCLDSY